MKIESHGISEVHLLNGVMEMTQITGDWVSQKRSYILKTELFFLLKLVLVEVLLIGVI